MIEEEMDNKMEAISSNSKLILRIPLEVNTTSNFVFL
jgi:hypothetical protein